jgi:hypothetical protein
MSNSVLPPHHASARRLAALAGLPLNSRLISGAALA